MKRFLIGLLCAGALSFSVLAQQRLAPPKVTTLTGLNGNQGDIVNLVGTGDYQCTSTTCTSAGQWKQITTGTATGLGSAFTTLPVSGQTTITSSGATALTVAAGSNVTLTTNNTTKTLTIAASSTAPSGSGTELQYRSGASTFGAVTGSSVSGADVTLGGSVSVASGIVSPTGVAGGSPTPGTLLTITAGAGGAGDGSADGEGGALTITSGAGGAGTTGGTDGANAGLLSILGGVGGAGSVTDPSQGGRGGAILIQAGDSGLGNNELPEFGGDLTLRTGASTTADVAGAGRRSGNLLVETAAPSQGFGASNGGGTSGTLFILTANGGFSELATGGDSGEIRLKTGDGGQGVTGGSAGQLSLFTGVGRNPTGDGYGGSGGAIQITAGNGGNGVGGGFESGSGGGIALTAGNKGSASGGATAGTPGNIALTVSTGGSIYATGGPVIGDNTFTATDFIVSGSRFKSDTTDGHTAGFAAYDVDGTTYRDVLTCTNGNAVACTLGTPTGGSLNVLTDMLKIAATTVGSLGTCDAGASGQVKYVTDALLPVALATVGGGGAVKVPVFCNGTAWTVF